MQAPAAESARSSGADSAAFWGQKILNRMYRFFRFKNRLLNGRAAAV